MRLLHLEILIQWQILPLHGQFAWMLQALPLTLAERVTWLGHSEVISQWGASSLCHSSRLCATTLLVLSFTLSTFSFTLILGCFSNGFAEQMFLFEFPSFFFLLTCFSQKTSLLFLFIHAPLWGAGGRGGRKTHSKSSLKKICFLGIFLCNLSLPTPPDIYYTFIEKKSAWWFFIYSYVKFLL